MKILFTGASSFTGYHIIKKMVQKSHSVTAVFTKTDFEAYSGIRKIRVKEIMSNCENIFNCSFGDEKFQSLIRLNNYDLLCHHASVVTNYKSPTFDILAACKSNTKNIDLVMRSLKEKCIPIVFTGSYFEMNEGVGTDNLISPTPYTISKSLSFEIIKYYGTENGIRLAKFVIPNPFGPFEEERFTSYLMKMWLQKRTPIVQTPRYVRDNIHSDLLAATYIRFVEKFFESDSYFMKINPSQYIGSQADFTNRYSIAIRERLDLPCEFELCTQNDFPEPIIRINTDNAELYCPDWDEKKAWDKIAEYYESAYKAGLL